MKKITKANYYLEGKTIYRENSDCSYWTLGAYDYFHNWYEATNDETGETAYFTTSDLVGDYIV